MLRRVPGHVKHAHLDVPELELFVVLNRSVFVRRRSTVVQDVLGTCFARERTPRRAVIRVDVRIDDEFDRESCFLRDAQVRRRGVDRIDNGRRRATASAKEVRRSDGGLGVKEVAKNHGLSGERYRVRNTINHFPDATGNPFERQSGSPSFARRAR